METQEILKELEFYNGSFPRRALEEAIARRDEIIPALLEYIDKAEQNAEDLLEQENYMAHIYAMYLLAQFREKRAYPLIVRFFSLPGELTLELTGDVVTEDLGRILASVSCGDPSLMIELVENEQANEYVRSAALRGLLTLAACGERSREEIMSIYKSFFTERLARRPSFVWSNLVSYATDLYPEEVYDDIKQVFEEELVDSSVIDLEWVDEHLTFGKEHTLAILREENKLIEDTIGEIEWWAGFREPDRRLAPQEPAVSGSELFRGMPEPPKPYVAKPKVGRNEPCPCGSGRKYKKCCEGN